MSGLRAAAGGSISSNLTANIQPPPKKIVNQETPSNQLVSIRASSENLSNALSARAGLDASDILKARINALMDQAQQAVTKSGFKPIDIAGPVILDPAKTVENAKNLAQNAKDFGAEVWQQIENYRNDKVNVSDLGEGDSIRLNSKTVVAFEVGIGVEANYEIKCTKKTLDSNPNNPGQFISEYTVTGEISPEVKIALGITEIADAPGLKIEYKFKNDEELKIFLKVQQQTANKARCVLDINTKEIPKLTSEDKALIKNRISSIEIRNDVNAEFDVKVGLKDALEIGANPALKARNAIKIEYKNGQPTHFVRTVEVSGGIDKLGLQIPIGKNKTGIDEIAAKFKVLEGKHTLTFETKIPIDSVKGMDFVKLIADPIGNTQFEKAETTVKYVREDDYGDIGTQFEMEISDLTPEETKQFAKSLTAENPSEALKDVKANVKTKTSVFTDEGFNQGIDLSLKGYGIEVHALAEKRDVRAVSQTENKNVGF